MSDTGDLYGAKLVVLTGRAIGRLRRCVRTGAPSLSAHFNDWTASLAGGLPPERYFTHPDAFPMLLLPWLLEASIRGTPDRAFQRDLVYSTVSGYYFVRLVDDAMDGGRPPAAELLPALIVLHAEFQHAFQRHFPADHPFWQAFFGASYEAAETASADAAAEDIGRAEFIAVSARKTAGARIPIAAVCHRHDRAELLGPWNEFVETLGRWHQMRNDLFDWRRDLERGAATYLLSEGRRHVGADGSVAGWVLSDGLEWAMAQLDGWMEQMLDAAARLDSPQLVAYLGQRQRRLAERLADLKRSVVAVVRLSSILG